MKRLLVDDDEEFDSELQAALEASVAFERDQAWRQTELDALYQEMRRNADKQQLVYRANQNYIHNQTYVASPMTSNYVLLVMMDHLNATGLNRLYRCSKYVGELMLDLVERYPIKSLEVPLSFYSFDPFFWRGALFVCMAKTIETLRFTITTALMKSYFYHYPLGHRIIRVILNVPSAEALRWFKRVFGFTSKPVQVYLTTIPFEVFQPRVGFAPPTTEEIPDAIIDPGARRFHALRNFTQSVIY